VHICPLKNHQFPYYAFATVQIFCLVRKSQIRKFLRDASPQIANRQIFVMISPPIRKFPWCPSPQIANPQICEEKSNVSDPDPHSFALKYFFYLRKYS
jgi:hypothetical protein